MGRPTLAISSEVARNRGDTRGYETICAGRAAPGRRRRGLIGMASIHDHPPSVLDRELFGDWEGDLTRGASNASAVGALVERKSHFMMLVKIKDARQTPR